MTYRNMTPNSVQGWNTSYGFLPFQRVINAFAGRPAGDIREDDGVRWPEGKRQDIRDAREGEVPRYRDAPLENPVWHRIQQLTVRGERVGNGQAVDAALSASRRSPPNVGTDRRVVGIGAVEALEQYVRAQKTVTPVLRTDIKVV